MKTALKLAAAALMLSVLSGCISLDVPLVPLI